MNTPVNLAILIFTFEFKKRRRFSRENREVVAAGITEMIDISLIRDHTSNNHSQDQSAGCQ